MALATMKSSSDPSIHRHREQMLSAHIQKLLADDRLRLDTVTGNRAITTLIRDVSRYDHALEVKRLMSEMGRPDRELQSRMPLGETLEVTLSQKRLFFFRQTVGRLRVICASPTRALIAGEDPQPMETAELQRMLGSLPPSLGGVPATVVVMSTSGFSLEAHELADRHAGRSVILVEPNGAGGWTVTGPPEAKNIADLFDPEGDEEKRQRVRDEIEQSRLELSTGGIAAERLATKLKLPAPLVEAELKAYAKGKAGLVAKRLEGRFVMYSEGSAPSTHWSARGTNASASGGSAMPLIDRMKSLFGRKGDEEKKVAYLSERRTALSQQRDRAYEDLGSLEQQEEALVRQFKEAAGSITKRRVTSQLLQLRKDLERRQQLLGVLNQQINVVSTHLHNLELVQQGQSAQLPDTEEITSDAVKAEEMLAELEANAELVGSVAMSSGATGLTAEEQALFEELEAEHTQEKADKVAANEKAAADKSGGRSAESPRAAAEPARSAPPPIPSRARRSEPEAG